MGLGSSDRQDVLSSSPSLVTVSFVNNNGDMSKRCKIWIIRYLFGGNDKTLLLGV